MRRKKRKVNKSSKVSGSCCYRLPLAWRQVYCRRLQCGLAVIPGHTNDYRYQYEILEYSTGLFVLDERSLTVPLCLLAVFQRLCSFTLVSLQVQQPEITFSLLMLTLVFSMHYLVQLPVVVRCLVRCVKLSLLSCTVVLQGLSV